MQLCNIRTRRPSPQSALLFIGLILAILLASCGHPDQTLDEVPPTLSPSTNPTVIDPELDPRPIPTFSPEQATAIAEKLQPPEHYRATVAALPPGPVDGPFPTDEPRPTPTLVLGIKTSPDDCNNEATSKETFFALNCWSAIFNGVHITVRAGGEEQDSSSGEVQQGGVIVYTRTLDLSNPMPQVSQIYETPTRAGWVTIVQVDGTRLTLQADNGATFVFDLTTRTWVRPDTHATVTATPAPTCELYPIALHASALDGAVMHDEIQDILNGTDAGNFGWLTWSGDQGNAALVQSLTPPGNSQSYANPDNPADHTPTQGDWVRGRPGVDNAQAVRSALESLVNSYSLIVVPVWDQASGHGSTLRYHIVGFVWVIITAYHLPDQQRISALYWGPATCT